MLYRLSREVAKVLMDDRKSRVLQAIIDDYVATAEPVGSRTLARKYQLGVSPATIRNEMADLEELGFLEQPHTSAGRVPSNRGYRYYVDCLMEAQDLTPAEEEQIRQVFQRRVSELDTLIQQTARLLSETTHYTSLVSGPQTGKAHFHQLQIVPLDEERALLVMVTDTGMVENQVIEVPVEVTLLECKRISGIITEQLRGQSLDRLNASAVRQLQNELSRYRALLEQTMYFLVSRSNSSEQERVFLGGTTNMLAQPEFRNVDKLRALLQVLEQERLVQDILLDEHGAVAPTGVHVQIGEEIRLREMQDCSLITATYRVGDETIGRIGVLGPRRMEYGKVVAVVQEVADRLSDQLRKRAK